jgi:hypothetical protein
VGGNLTVDVTRNPGNGRKAEHGRQGLPPPTQRGEHACDGRRTRETMPAGGEDPGVTVHSKPAETVLLQHPGSLIRYRQHTAGTIAGTHPASGPRSKASGAVEEQDERLLRGMGDLHGH